MLSKFFKIKTQSKEFEEYINNLINEIKDKKIIIYGAGEGFLELNKKYKFNEILNVVAIADKKFENENSAEFEGMKAISPEKIPNEDFDLILISNENSRAICEYLYEDIDIEDAEFKTIFKEDIPDEQVNYNELISLNFEKTLPKLIKKLNNKKVVLYGAGSYLELIKKYFDISALDVIGIADRRFAEHNENDEFLSYKAYAPNEIADLKPDYVVVATKFYTNIVEDLYYKTLKGTKIKIVPLVKKPFWTLVKEIWS